MAENAQNMSPQKSEDKSGKVLVYARYIRLKDGRIIYPKKSKVFRFWVSPKNVN